MSKTVTILAGMALGAIGLSGFAVAADLPSSRLAPPPPPVVIPRAPTFTGFYVGAEVGGAFGSNTDSGYGPGFASDTSRYSPKGVVGGGLVGYNYQFDHVVVGVEGDVEGSGINKSQSQFGGLGAAGGGQVSLRNNFRASTRGRIGYAFDSLLFYATGGAAFANYRLTEAVAGLPSEQFRSTRTGYTVGAGVEYALSNSLTARVEYRYSDFGSWTNGSSVLPGFTYSERLRDNAIRVGVAYKFGSPDPAPVVARY